MKTMQKTLDGTPVTVRNIGQHTEISQCEAVGSQAATNCPHGNVILWTRRIEGLCPCCGSQSCNCKPEPTPRNPQIISGALRLQAERILARGGVSAREVSDCDDARRICELLDELDSSLLQSQLRDSMRGKR